MTQMNTDEKANSSGSRLTARRDDGATNYDKKNRWIAPVPANDIALLQQSFAEKGGGCLVVPKCGVVQGVYCLRFFDMDSSFG